MKVLPGATLTASSPDKSSAKALLNQKIITNITNHLGDLVIELSIYVNQQMATTFKDILNDIFTARAETNMEKSDREDTEKEKDGQ